MALIPLVLLTGCFEAISNTEAREAMLESFQTAKAEVATNDVIEVTTSFTLGQAAEDAAEELRAFLASQVPCSEVTRDGASVTLDFGTLEDDCVYNGHTYAGLATVTLDEITASSASVHHAWQALTDGEVTLDGDADVAWDVESVSRHVVHEANWSFSNGDLLVGSGDVTQTILEDGSGIEVNGTRDWLHDEDEWALDIVGVELRAMDPVPQAGQYDLVLPDGRVLTLAFVRIDDDTIEVTLTGTRRPLTIQVTSAGEEI